MLINAQKNITRTETNDIYDDSKANDRKDQYFVSFLS